MLHSASLSYTQLLSATLGFHLCHWLQITANLLNLTKSALDIFVFDSVLSPANVADTLTADADLLVVPPSATAAVQVLNQAQVHIQLFERARRCRVRVTWHVSKGPRVKICSLGPLCNLFWSQLLNNPIVTR